MRFGVALETFTPPGRSPSINSVYKCAETAELYGYDSVWTWDHIFLGTKKVFPILDCLTTLAAISGRTSKVNLGTGILVMALRNPVVLSKAISTLQFISNGRLILGAASGWYEREFRSTGIAFSQRGSIFEEKFQLVRRLLNENEINYTSGQIVLEHATMEPKFPQSVPMLIGGYSDRVLSRAGRLSDGWISYYYAPEGYASSWKKVEESAVRNGRDRSKLRRVNIVPLALASTFEEADRIAKDFTIRYTDLPENTGCTVESSIRGSVKECINQIRKFESAGVQDLVLIPCNYDQEYIEKFGKEILPDFVAR